MKHPGARVSNPGSHDPRAGSSDGLNIKTEPGTYQPPRNNNARIWVVAEATQGLHARLLESPKFVGLCSARELGTWLLVVRRAIAAQVHTCLQSQNQRSKRHSGTSSALGPFRRASHWAPHHRNGPAHVDVDALGDEEAYVHHSFGALVLQGACWKPKGSTGFDLGMGQNYTTGGPQVLVFVSI